MQIPGYLGRQHAALFTGITTARQRESSALQRFHTDTITIWQAPNKCGIFLLMPSPAVSCYKASIIHQTLPSGLFEVDPSTKVVLFVQNFVKRCILLFAELC